MEKTILLVEDNEDAVFLTQAAFKKSNITNPLNVVGDGQEAINYFVGLGQYADRSRFPIPYLVLLDLKLPLVPGLDVLKSIRHLGMSTIVVVLSTSENESDIALAYRLGANAYLLKPSSLDKLFESMRHLKNFWLEENRPPPPAEAGLLPTAGEK
jgi:DNA-binding response OmpR family regulator